MKSALYNCVSFCYILQKKDKALLYTDVAINVPFVQCIIWRDILFQIPNPYCVVAGASDEAPERHCTDRVWTGWIHLDTPNAGRMI